MEVGMGAGRHGMMGDGQRQGGKLGGKHDVWDNMG